LCERDFFNAVHLRKFYIPTNQKLLCKAGLIKMSETPKPIKTLENLKYILELFLILSLYLLPEKQKIERI